MGCAVSRRVRFCRRDGLRCQARPSLWPWREGAVGLLRGLRVGDVYVVCGMARHELIARDAVQQDVHDGPLRRDGLQAALGLLGGKLDGGGEADVCVELAARAEDAAPDDGARLADALRVPPPRRKYMGGWRSLAAPAYPPAMCDAGTAPEI